LGRLTALVGEARRRRVFRTGGLYVVGAWVMLQVADLALSSMGLPDSLLRYIWFAAFAGLPLALVFGWYYEITPGGIRKTPAVGNESVGQPGLGIPDYAIIVAIAVIAGVFAAGLFDRAREAGELASTPFDPDGIAVLPLENLSGSEDQVYFSAGMHDALITNLSKISALRVVSRTSTMRLDPTMTIPQIGETLGVRNIIEGSVTREGDRVRVIVQLIDAANDAHIWAENFEREFSGVLQLQDEMAKAIAQEVNVRLSEDEQAELARNKPVDPDVYDAYLRGMYFLNQPDNKVRRRGIRILEGVVDDGKADAYVYAALAYGYAVLGHSPYPEGMYPASKRAAQRAMELDDSIADVHLALGMHHAYYEWNFVAAEAELRRAIELNPNLTGAHFHYAWLQELLQRSERSLPEGELTVRLDPLSPGMRMDLAAQYRNAGRFDKALELADQSLDMAPGYARALRIKATTLAAMGRFDEALEVSEALAGDPMVGFTHGVILAWAGRADEARRVLVGIEQIPQNVMALTLLNAALGDDEAVFRWLDVAKDVRLPWYPWLITWLPEMARYRDDPRLIALARELGLDEVLVRL